MSDDTRRELLSKTFDDLAAAEPEPVVEAAPAEVVTEKAPESESLPAPAEGRTRDERGRFAPGSTEKPAATPAAPGKGETPAAAGKEAGALTPPAPAPTEAPKAFKAPQSWKPLARERWAALPPEVQEEIDRREREVPQALQQAAEARKFHDAFREVVAPYEGMIRANGSEPLRSVASLMQTAAALQMGSPQQKAAIAAQIIRGYGIDIEALASQLDSPQQPQQAAPQQYQDPRAVVREEFQSMLQQARQQKLAAQVQEFEQKHEFATDPKVKAMMASLMEHGVETSLEGAYNLAIGAIPDYAAVMRQREAAKAAQNTAAQTAQAKAAASSIRSQPTAAPAAQPVGRRAVLEAAFDRQSR